jgi:carbonic anhydrase
MSKNKVFRVPESWYVSGGNRGFTVLTRTTQKSRNRGLALPALAALPPSNNTNTNDNILDFNDDDYFLIDVPTAVSNVSFSMDSHDRESYKSDVSVTFGFTPTTASPSYVKLNYPLGFFSNYPTPTCTVSAQGTTMTPGAPGNTSITLSVTGTALAAGSPVTVTLVGCKMGSSMSATNSITVQTSTDTVPSSPALSSGVIHDNHIAKAFVITCIDFRLIDEAVAYLNSINLLNEYDEFIVAGASLGYNTSCNVVTGKTTTLWTQCVDDHIEISYALHKISQIIVVDHMACGAFKHQLNNGNAFNPYDELKEHVKQLNDFRTTINGKYTKDKSTVDTTQIPKYTVKPCLMNLNGSVDENPTHWQVDVASTTTLVFNLAKNDVVTINGTNGTNGLPIPTTTMLSELQYELLNSDMTVITTNFVKIYQDNGIWNIQNSKSEQEFYNSTSNTRILSYIVKVVGTNAYINLTMTTAYNAFYIRTGGSDWKTRIINNDTSNANIEYWNPDSQWYDTNYASDNEIALQFRFFAAYVTKYYDTTSGSVNVFTGNGNVGTYSFTHNGGSSYTGNFTGYNFGNKTWDYTLSESVTTRDTVQFKFYQGSYNSQSGWN